MRRPQLESLLLVGNSDALFFDHDCILYNFLLYTNAVHKFPVYGTIKCYCIALHCIALHCIALHNYVTKGTFSLTML